ncbi:uncharacterized protein LOC118645398 [Monomorium pharaonis]|uniref:uncharacterized protein LOC118645398 n=1 Tax=Monomorium pharaonis TaxID=307658 RepID=UPI00174635C9|nr:uncharacterized protein LOC118645398 [Monomorium pharaonis]
MSTNFIGKKRREEGRRLDECSNNIAVAMEFPEFRRVCATLHLGHLGVGAAYPGILLLRGHFMPPIAGDTGTLSTTLGDHPESFSDRKTTTERRARFNLRRPYEAAARRGAFPFSPRSSAARFNNRGHDNDDELSRKPDLSPRSDKSYRDEGE